MGSKLTVLAAVIALAGTAAADQAGDALKKGIELYKAGKYAEALPHLEKAQKLAPNPNTLFAIAQAQRQSGDCLAAATNYHKLLEQLSDLATAKAVETSLLLCEPDEKKPEPVKEEKRDEPQEAPKPEVVEKVVYRDGGGGTDKLAAALFGGGMLAVGVAGGLYVAASNNADAADRAKSLPDHDLLADRATTQRTIMYVAGGVGVAMMGVAIFRWTRSGSGEKKADIALVPTSGGGSLFVSSRF